MRTEFEDMLIALSGHVDSLERAIHCAYRGSAEHGSFLRGGSGEYVPSVFMTLNETRAQMSKMMKLLRALPDGTPTGEK